MQVSEVFPIVRHHSPTISTDTGQHSFVRDLLLASPRVLDGLHVVPSFPQSLNSRLGEIFIRIQPDHVLGCLIGVDPLLDLLPMRTFPSFQHGQHMRNEPWRVARRHSLQHLLGQLAFHAPLPDKFNQQAFPLSQ